MATSAAANIEPSAKQTTASGTTDLHGIGGRAPVWCPGGCGSGCVARWAARYSDPPTPLTSAIPRPAQARQVVASTVATVGPMMKMASSITDSRAYAVWISVGSPSST